MRRNEPLLAPYLQRFRDDPDYVLEGLYLEITEWMSAHMEAEGITQAELARRMGLSEARVCRIFTDSCNLTLRTVARMLVALEAEMDVRVRKRASASDVRDDWPACAQAQGRRAEWPAKLAEADMWALEAPSAELGDRHESEDLAVAA